MTSQYRHRRSSDPTKTFPTLEPGEISTNTANRQIAVGDAASGTIGQPLPLLAVRFFDARAIYAIGDLVVQAGKGYRALVANGPGAFNAAQWELASAQLVVSQTPPAGVSDGTLWWESDTGILYVRYNDGNTTQWVIAAPQPDVSQFVQKTGDTMSGPLIVPAPTLPTHAANKAYVDAAAIAATPFDALAYNGMQINGSMDVSQELNGSPQTVSGQCICDGWRLYTVGSMAVSAGQAASVGSFPGIPNILYCLVSTAQASMGAGDQVCFFQSIEGRRVARLAWGGVSAQPITIGFWTAHHRTGLYSGTIRNAAGNRSYAFVYTQAIADGPQYNVVTIPGDTTGTWNIDNTGGMLVTFAMAAGTSLIAPSANGWLAGNYIAAPGQINGVAATSDAFRITGVVVLPGTQAPSAARSALIMRPYDQELLTCMRYYETGLEPHLYTQPATAGVIIAYGSLPFMVTKRTAPTMTGTGWQYFNTGGSPVAFTPVFGIHATGFWWTATGLTNWAGWYNATGAWKADARL